MLRFLNNSRRAARAKTQGRKLILKKNFGAFAAWRETIFQTFQFIPIANTGAGFLHG
jgi:hypothetical protein